MRRVRGKKWLVGAAMLCTLVPLTSAGETFRDEFNAPSFSGNDGTVSWSGDWIEVDGAGAGPSAGNVLITSGELSLDDSPNTGGEPSLEREADLSSYTAAYLSFAYRTTSGVDSSDSVVVEISANGGGAWTVLETFSGISGVQSGTRFYDVSGFIAANTRVRFRVENLYGGSNEQFLVDDVEILALCGSGEFRDEFNLPPTFSGNDGTLLWTGDWIEVDGAGAGPVSGNVTTNGGELRLDDRPNTGGEPSLEREADLSSYTTAVLSFDFDTTGGVDSSDSVIVEISDDGGASWATLENFTGITGSSSGSRSYDVSASIAANTRIRFRVNANYGGFNERFAVDNVSLVVAQACGPHFAILHDGSADICQAEPVTIAVHDVSHGVDAGYTGTISLSTSTGNGDWSLISGAGTLVNSGSGNATYSFDPADAGQVGLALRNTVVETLNIDVSDGTLNESEDPDLTFSSTANEVVRDDFGAASYGNQDGTVNWSTDWIEFDVAGPGPSAGNVLIVGGELSLDDYTNTDTDPTLEREVDLSSAVAATLRFAFRTTSGVDSNDSIFVEASSNGGLSWTVLENITGISGATSGTRSYDLSPYLSSNTRIRLRVNGLNGTGGTSCCYGAANENFLVDWLEVEYSTAATCGPDHFELVHDGQGIHCVAEAVTVSAVDSGGVPLAGYDQEVTLDTQTGRGTWALVSGNGTLTDPVADDGLATYTFDPADGGSAVVELSYTQGTTPVDVDVFETASPAIRDDDSEGPLDWGASGFTVTASPLPNPPPSPISDPIPSQTAGTDFLLHLAAFGTTPTDPQCGVIETYAGAKLLPFWSTQLDPPGGPVSVTIDGTPIGNSEPAATPMPVSFTAGQAVVTAKYKDVGRIQIQMKDDSVPEPPTGIRGGSNPFVVLPADFAITSVVRPDQTANPGSAIPTGPIFVPAGGAFGVTVEVRDAEGDLTPSYGNESSPEGILLTSSTLVAPAGGRNGSADDGTIGNGTAFGTTRGDGSPTLPGEFYGGAFFWDEVGAIRLRASVGDGSYLGAGDVSGAESGTVGRFTPFDFNVGYNAPSVQTACTAGAFTYMDQPFGFAAGGEPVLTVTARAAGGTTTQNYSGAWWRLTNASLAGRSYQAFSGTLDPSGLPPAAADPTIVDAGAGTGTLTFSSGAGLLFQRAAPVAPFDAEISLEINVLDEDGVAYAANPARFGQPLPGLGIPFSAGNELRYGRLILENAYGSELVPLPVPLQAQYFDGLAFRANAADGCTSLPVGSLLLTPNPPGLPTVPSIANDPLAAGDAGLSLSAPGAGNSGTVDLEFDLSPGGAGMPWLQYDWPHDGNLDGALDDNPRSRATFGIYAGPDSLIYLREIY